MNTIEHEIEAARKKLLDLTMRNKLLNFKPSKSGTLRITDEVPREVFNILVILEKGMEFLPIPPKDEKEGADQDGDTDSDPQSTETSLTVEEQHLLWSMPQIDQEAESRHTDRYLQTNLEPEPLQKRLFKIYQDSSSILEEQGYTVLFLAIGFLSWKESPSALDFRTAPLILVPVELQRKNARAGFSINWTGEEVQTNQSLQAKLLDHQIQLPDFELPENKEGVDEYFEQVKQACSRQPGWNIEPGLYLNFFNFAKFVMYKDLDPKTWSNSGGLLDNPLLKEILDPSSKEDAEPNSSELFDETRIDEQIDFRNVYHVMDADPSQIGVIEDIKNGTNLVVEGPPGTGKSQTITNAIAELLAQGKKVLFVSEKMAALEVVKARLDHVGLGDFCLELHSRKAKKKEVLAELQTTVNKKYSVTILPDEVFHRFEQVKKTLNQYAADLRTYVGARGLTVFQVLSQVEAARTVFRRIGKTPQFVPLEKVQEITPLAWEEAKSLLKSISEVLPMVSPIKDNPWKGARLTQVLPSDEPEIERLLLQTETALHELIQANSVISKEAGFTPPVSLSQTATILDYAGFLSQGIPNIESVFRNQDWNTCHEFLSELFSVIKSCRDRMTVTMELFQLSALDLDTPNLRLRFEVLCRKFCSLSKKFKGNTQLIQEGIDLLAEFEELKPELLFEFNQDTLDPLVRPWLRQFLERGESLFRSFSGRYREAKKQILPHYKAYKKRSHKEITKDLTKLERYFIVTDELENRSKDLRAFFGELWKDHQSQSGELQSFMDWVLSITDTLGSDCLGDSFGQAAGRTFGEEASSQFKDSLCEFESLQRTFQSVRLDNSPIGFEDFLANLKQLESTQSLLGSLNQLEEQASALFGILWKGLESDTLTLESCSTWMPIFLSRMEQGAFSEETVFLMSDQERFKKLGPLMEELVNKRDSYAHSVSALLERLKAPPAEILGNSIAEITFDQFLQKIAALQTQLHRLQPWSQFQSLKQSATSTFANPILGRIDEDALEESTVLPTLSVSYAESLLKEVFSEFSSISQFLAPIHENRIEDFRDLDRVLIKNNRSRLISRLWI